MMQISYEVVHNVHVRQLTVSLSDNFHTLETNKIERMSWPSTNDSNTMI